MFRFSHFNCSCTKAIKLYTLCVSNFCTLCEMKFIFRENLAKHTEQAQTVLEIRRGNRDNLRLIFHISQEKHTCDVICH